MNAPADRALERVMLANFVVHMLAMASMAALLLPALPGSGGSDDARIAYIADHPWLFRAGWFPWQLCALFDLVLAICMVRVRWLSRVSVAVLALTVVAVWFDQSGELGYMNTGVALARAGDVAGFLAFERDVFPLSAAWGALFYTLAALGWTWCFARARTWSRFLSVLSAPLWLVMFAAALAVIAPVALRPSSLVVAALNAAGFTLLQPWLFVAAEMVLRRARPDAAVGRLAPWRAPLRAAPWTVRRGLAWASELVANSRALHALCAALPPPALISDVRDVIYVNYLVDAARLVPFVPEGLELQRVGKDGAHALFTFLTFRHGHFGPRFLGPLRALFPSPVQSNWRIHVRDPHSGALGVFFVTSAVDSLLYAIGARLFAECMPMHLVEAAVVDAVETPGEVRVDIALDPGAGSAPDCAAALTSSPAPVLDGAWRACFEDWRAFLAYCVPQDRALSSTPTHLVRQEIDLGIALDACEPLAGTVSSRAASAIVGDAAPLCFRVASLTFRFLEQSRTAR